ncbi:MAG: C39 family peptidase [Clostridiales bacterium]|nr:C39 family peptidase [Clostridiales bacterium]
MYILRKTVLGVMSGLLLGCVITGTSFASDTELDQKAQVLADQVNKQAIFEEYQKGQEEKQLNQAIIMPTEQDLLENEKQELIGRQLDEMYEAYFNDEISLEELQQKEYAYYKEHDPAALNNPNASFSTDPEFIGVKEKVQAHRLAQKRMSLPDNQIKPYAIGDGEQKYLPMPYEYQITGYYCGPATAVNIVNGYNRYSRITQNRAAALLGTDEKKGTPLGTNWKNVLNSTYMGKNYNIAWGYPGWAADLADKSIRTIRGGRGVALNVLMDSSTGYLPGYSYGTIYHYVAGYGFDSSDPSRRYISYLDVNNQAGPQGAHRVSYQLMGRCTQRRGLVW